MKYAISCGTSRTSKFVVEPIETSQADAREAIEVGLHHSALLVVEELDVALPDEIIGPLPGLRGRPPVLQGTASLVDRLEAGEDGYIVALLLQEST